MRKYLYMRNFSVHCYVMKVAHSHVAVGLCISICVWYGIITDPDHIWLDSMQVQAVSVTNGTLSTRVSLGAFPCNDLVYSLWLMIPSRYR